MPFVFLVYLTPASSCSRPVLQPVLLAPQQRLRRVAVLVEVLGEAALAAGEVDEVTSCSSSG